MLLLRPLAFVRLEGEEDLTDADAPSREPPVKISSQKSKRGKLVLANVSTLLFEI